MVGSSFLKPRNDKRPHCGALITLKWMASMTDRRHKSPKQLPDWQEKLLSEGAASLEHGDYQRIADFTLSPKGKPYTADYVRKVLLGMRENEDILYLSHRFLQLKAKQHVAMKKAMEKRMQARK